MNIYLSAIQVFFKGESKSTQCCLPPVSTSKGPQYDLPQEDDPLPEIHIGETSDTSHEEDVGIEMIDDDDEWLPSSEEEEKEEEINVEEEKTAESHCHERKYIVFESCLLQLFAICNVCLAPAMVDKRKICGTMVAITATCSQGHTREWKSQPQHNRMLWGNLLMAAACLFSGSQPTKLLLFFKHFNLSAISERLFNPKILPIAQYFQFMGQPSKRYVFHSPK